jgi:hypothetical protein
MTYVFLNTARGEVTCEADRFDLSVTSLNGT